MSATRDPEIFGRTEAGEDVHRVVLSSGGLTAKIMTWGTTLQDLRLEGYDAPLTLGFPDFESYPKYSSYFGQTPGRFANRIDKGRFTLDGRQYQLEQNEGENHLHGGKLGTGKRIWTIEDLAVDTVRLRLVDPDGFAGYPGTCTISCTYWLKADGVLSITYEATTDAPTICNIAHHNYFNLDGSDTILDHEAMIAADAYLPTRPDQIPTGEIKPVAGTAFDFRTPRPIRREEHGSQVPYDHNFCLSPARTGKRPVARVVGPKSGIALDVATTEAGVQFYIGFKLKPTVPTTAGRLLQPCAGFCLETQSWPDAPNHPDFAQATLRPSERLVQATDYIFSQT
ncbi:MAG: aldose epimerase family protein [Pararhizobium sp.]